MSFFGGRGGGLIWIKLFTRGRGGGSGALSLSTIDDKLLNLQSNVFCFKTFSNLSAEIRLSKSKVLRLGETERFEGKRGARFSSAKDPVSNGSESAKGSVLSKGSSPNGSVLKTEVALVSKMVDRWDVTEDFLSMRSLRTFFGGFLSSWKKSFLSMYGFVFPVPASQTAQVFMCKVLACSVARPLNLLIANVLFINATNG